MDEFADRALMWQRYQKLKRKHDRIHAKLRDLSVLYADNEEKLQHIRYIMQTLERKRQYLQGLKPKYDADLDVFEEWLEATQKVLQDF